MLEPSTLATTESVVPAWDAPVDPFTHDPRDVIPDEIIAALKARGLHRFDLRTAAVIGAAGVEGRIRVRIDDGRWSLCPLEASIVALMVRLDPDLSHADLYADAFCLGARQADNAVEAVHLQARMAAEAAA